MNKLFNFIDSHISELKNFSQQNIPHASLNDKQKALRVKTHKTISDFTHCLEQFQFNRAIAFIRELTNELFYYGLVTTNDDKFVVKESIEAIIQLLNPIIPHLTEDLWQNLGHKNTLVHATWPSFDKELLSTDTVTIAVQINGKLKGTIELDKTMTDEDEVKTIVLKNEKIHQAIAGKTIRRFIYIPGKIVNIVV